MKYQAVCFKQLGCSMQIFNSPALQVDHEKVLKNSNAKIKKKRKKRWSSFTAPKETHQDCARLQVLSGIRENELTVVLSLSAWELSSKVQNLKKKSKKRYNAARQKGKKEWKKCYYSFETNSSGLCIIAGVQWHHTNELTVVLSSKVQI